MPDPSPSGTPAGSARLARALAPILLAVATLVAADRVRATDYLIEVMLFENLSGDRGTERGLWFPKVGPALSLGGEAAGAADFRPVESGLSLEEEARAIAGSRGYRVLRHFAWRQPGLGAREAQAIRVNVGSAFDLYLPEDTAPYERFVPASSAPRPDRSRAIRSTPLTGTLKVRLGRFLHMEALLVYTDPEEQRSYRLYESRKMRSTELHYIDNPRFGLLTRILPIEDGDS